MHCAKFDPNWPSGSWKEENNVKSWQQRQQQYVKPLVRWVKFILVLELFLWMLKLQLNTIKYTYTSIIWALPVLWCGFKINTM